MTKKENPAAWANANGAESANQQTSDQPLKYTPKQHLKSTQPHRDFIDAGFRVIGLHPIVAGKCGCGNDDCHMAGKHPWSANWQYAPHWSDEQLETMELSGQFKTGYGVLVSGLLVIDIDPRNGGNEGYAALVEQFPEITGAGLIVATGRGDGGKHIYFRLSEPLALVTKLSKYPGVDFKSAGFVVGPGSQHISGGEYTVLHGTPDDIDEAPQALLDALKKPERHRNDINGSSVDVSHAEIADMLGYLDADCGYDDWVTAGMAIHHATDGTGFDLWDAWSNQSDKYPGKAKLGQHWHSFGKSANPVTLGTLWHRAKEAGWQPAIADDGLAERWADPAPRFLEPIQPPAPQLDPSSYLGEELASWVADAATAKGCPPDYIFIALLTVAGSVIGNSRMVMPFDEWKEPPILWSMCIGAPSSGKSPALDIVLQELHEIDRNLKKEVSSDQKEWEKKKEVYDLELKAWMKEAAKSIEQGKPASERPSDDGLGEIPNRARMLINDATIEKLGVLLAKQPRGILQMRDELSGWLTGMSRYSKDSSDRPFWLEAYGGRSYCVERLGREPIDIEYLSIGVLGGIQPDKLTRLLISQDDDGLLCRFIPIWPELAPITRPQKIGNRGLLKSALRRLYDLNPNIRNYKSFHPKTVPFSNEAQEEMYKFSVQIREISTNIEGLLLSFCGKLPGLTVRISLILAYLDYAIGNSAEPLKIEQKQFEKARALVLNYILPMAKRAYAIASLPQAETNAYSIVSIIQEHQWEKFSTRELCRLNKPGLKKIDDVNPSLKLLIEADIIKEENIAHSDKGGRPHRRYLVNPKIFL